MPSLVVEVEALITRVQWKDIRVHHKLPRIAWRGTSCTFASHDGCSLLINTRRLLMIDLTVAV